LLQFLADVQQFQFLQNALLTGLLASVACGIIGTYVVVRRISYLADGIAHAVLGGMGAALYLRKLYMWDTLIPLHGAIVAAIISAVIIGIVSLRTRQREDTIIGALWAVGMAAGIMFISKTPGYAEDLMSYLFGNILMVSTRDLWMLAILDLIIVSFGVIFYKQFLAVCFDAEFAKLRGIRVEFYFLLLLCLAALTVVMLSTVVGIVMVIALLTLPVGIASLFSRTLWQMMIASWLISTALTVSGIGLSYQPDLPPGPTVIILAGAAYLIATAGTWLYQRFRVI
jgi:zinc transport system permease protein